LEAGQRDAAVDLVEQGVSAVADTQVVVVAGRDHALVTEGQIPGVRIDVGRRDGQVDSRERLGGVTGGEDHGRHDVVGVEPLGDDVAPEGTVLRPGVREAGVPGR
jgi:hypothetical protein